MSEEVVLFDIPSVDDRSFALNPWKTRAVLNYKNIPYRTHWVEYPDIAPTLSKLGVPPNPSNISPYTTPTIFFRGEYTAESRDIAALLDAAFPEKPLHMDDPRLDRVIELLDGISFTVVSEFVAKVPRKLLKPRSAEYWRETRVKWVGMPVDEFEAKADVEQAWEKANPMLRELAGLVKDGVGGPYVHGKEPGYADILIAAMLHSYRILDEDFYRRLVAVDEALDNLYVASKSWLHRDDH